MDHTHGRKELGVAPVAGPSTVIAIPVIGKISSEHSRSTVVRTETINPTNIGIARARNPSFLYCLPEAGGVAKNIVYGRQEGLLKNVEVPLYHYGWSKGIGGGGAPTPYRNRSKIKVKELSFEAVRRDEVTYLDN